MHLRLCKLGYAQSLAEAEEMPARKVLQALAYESFCDDFEMAYLEINRT